jgi:hypothetical protein
MAWTAHRTGAQVMAVIGETTTPAIDGDAPSHSSSNHCFSGPAELACKTWLVRTAGLEPAREVTPEGF